MKGIVGIDPGLDGALALIVDGRAVEVLDMPVIEEDGKRRLAFEADGTPVERRGIKLTMDAAAVCAILASWRVMHEDLQVVIEHAQMRPEQGAASGGKAMYAAGELSGVAVGMGLRRTFVAANRWKSAMGVSAEKDTSLRRAKELEPHLAGRLTRKMDHGRAEAMLIGLWGWRNIA